MMGVNIGCLAYFYVSTWNSFYAGLENCNVSFTKGYTRFIIKASDFGSHFYDKVRNGFKQTTRTAI